MLTLCTTTKVRGDVMFMTSERKKIHENRTWYYLSYWSRIFQATFEDPSRRI